MKNKLCFRIPAYTNQFISIDRYFGNDLAANDYLNLGASKEIFEYEIFNLIQYVWGSRHSPNFGWLVNLKTDKESKQRLRLVIKHAREAWIALGQGNELQAHLEYTRAMNHKLLVNMGFLAELAGTSLLKKQLSVFTGEKNADIRWNLSTNNRKARDKRICDAFNTGSKVSDLAYAYNLSKRRIQQIVSNKTK